MRLWMVGQIISSVLVVIAVSGCGPSSPKIEQLQMPAEQFSGVREVYVRAMVNPDSPADTGSPAVSQALAASGVKAAAQFRYELTEPTVTMRVKVDLFRDQQTASTRFRGRHLPEALAMTEPLPIGDDGFIYEQAYAGFRVGPVAVEIRAKPEDPRLRDFAAAYADFVRRRLR